MLKAIRLAGFLAFVTLLLGNPDTILAGGPADAGSAPQAAGPAGQAVPVPLGPELSAAGVQHVFWHETTGRPEFLGAHGAGAADLGLPADRWDSPKDIALAFLQTYRSQMRLSETALVWDPERVEGPDSIGQSHVRLGQIYNGLPVLAAELLVHVEDAAVIGVNGEYVTAVRVPTSPALTPEEAFKAAVHHIGLANPVRHSSELAIYNPALLGVGASANHLAYQMVIGEGGAAESHTVVVDAHTGKILLSYTNLQQARNRSIHDANGSFDLPGTQCYDRGGRDRHAVCGLHQRVYLHGRLVRLLF